MIMKKLAAKPKRAFLKGIEKDFKFPLFKTKVKNIPRVFNLSNTKERKEYFTAKAGVDIQKIRNYLRRNTFIAYLLGKKNSGKGTYSKLFMEIVGSEKIAHISVGDVVRQAHQDISIPRKKKELIDFLQKNYRGYISIEDAIKALYKRSTKTLLPTEFILALVKKEISRVGKKALFIDGLPRDLDQVSYSLFFRDLVDYRADPDFFVLIDVPEEVIDKRIKYRRVCPKCKDVRNLKLHLAQKVKYNKKNKKFYFVCDTPECSGEKMILKEGDALGIKSIRKRLELDKKLIKQIFSLYGIPKVLLRNTVPVSKAKQYVDEYEITPEYDYKWNDKLEKVEIIEKPWKVSDNGVSSYSLLPSPVVVSMIKQIVKVLHL